MKTRIIALLSLLLCLSMGARASNTITITGGSGAPDAEVTVTIAMTNTDAVTAVQIAIPIDENLTYVTGSATKAEGLASDFSVSAGMKNGILNVMVYSLSLATIPAGNGDLLTLRLKLGDTPTTITLTPSTLTLTGSDGTVVESQCQSGTVSIRCAKAQYSRMNVDFGRKPIRSTYHETLTVSNVGNEPLTVSSLTFSDATVLSSTTAVPFNVAAGSSAQIDVTYAPTERGNMNKTLTVGCNSISPLNTISIAAQPYAVNELRVGNASGISDTEVEVVLTMNNMDDIIGFQAEFTMPSTLEYVTGSFALNNDRREDHIASASVSNGKLRIVGYSASGSAFKGSDGAIGSFRVLLDGRSSVTLSTSKAILTAIINGESTDVLSAAYSGTISIQSPRISGNSSLAFSKVPVTQDVEKTYTIRNNGSAPLTVSRINFLNEGFSVKESLPIVINNNQSQTVTVVKEDKTEGDFATTMQIYSNDPGQRLLNVSVTGNIFAPNYLTLTADNIYGGDDAVLHVGTDNYDAIEGIQFDIESTDDYTVEPLKTRKTERGQGFSVAANRINETTTRVVCYLMGGSIARGEGELVALKLKPTTQQTNGQHSLSVKNVKLGTTDKTEKYAGAATLNVSYNVTTAVMGDANRDGETSVMDVIGVINDILQETPMTFSEKAADVNGDGEISVMDVISLIDMILNNN